MPVVLSRVYRSPSSHFNVRITYILTPQSFCRPPPPKPIRHNLLQKRWGQGGVCNRHPNTVPLFPKPFRCNTYEPPHSVANKRLTAKLNPLSAALTQNRGGTSFTPIISLSLIKPRQAKLLT